MLTLGIYATLVATHLCHGASVSLKFTSYHFSRTLKFEFLIVTIRQEAKLESFLLAVAFKVLNQLP